MAISPDGKGSNEIALLAEEGDLLMISVYDAFFRYQRQDDRRLFFRRDATAPYKVFMNDQLIALTFTDEPAVWEWLRNCDAREFRKLRSINWVAGNAELALLKRLAKARPGLGLYVDLPEDSLPLARQLISLFTPSWLLIGGGIINADLLPKLNRLELLLPTSEEDFSFIEKLPRLNALIYGEGFAGGIDAARLPGSLRSLTLNGLDIENPAGLGHLKKLRNLHLVDCSIKDADSFPVFTKLREVGFAACEDLAYAPALQSLSSLEWITFPPSTSQEEFAHCIDSNPSLQVVGIAGCERIRDLSSLKRLPKLKGLLLSPSKESLPAIPELPNLEVLLIGGHEADEQQIQQYQTALPNTQVVPGGYCLGSGWILLLVPLVALLSLAVHCRKKGSGG